VSKSTIMTDICAETALALIPGRNDLRGTLLSPHSGGFADENESPVRLTVLTPWPCDRMQKSP
jgi:hypothetical protein